MCVPHIECDRPNRGLSSPCSAYNSLHRGCNSSHSTCEAHIETLEIYVEVAKSHKEVAYSYIEVVAAHPVPPTSPIAPTIDHAEAATAHKTPETVRKYASLIFVFFSLS